MEIGKSREESLHGNQRTSRWRIAQKAVRGIASNPLIMMTVLGILGNLVFHHVMPDVIHGFLGTLGSAFSASALFLLGKSS
jgi:predicted permease